MNKEGRLLLLGPLFSVVRSGLMHLWEKRKQESCVEESRIKLEYMVLHAEVFWARIEQMHINCLSLKQGIYTDSVWLWACCADIGCYSDRCQEYEGKLGFVRDMEDIRLISLAARRTVS